MNYHNITTDDMLNGEGLRVVLWVSGCSHKCPGCQNPITWNPDDGLPFDEDAKKELFDKLRKNYISGITYSGGDPLFCSNRMAIKELSAEINEKFPNKTQWLYTGYTWEEIADNPELKSCLENIDVLVEGPFVQELLDPKYPWAGSTNQRVMSLKS